MWSEPKVMSQIAKLLEPLDGAARSRVLGWTISALGVRDLPKLGDGSSRGDFAEPTDRPQLESRMRNSRLNTEIEDWLFDEQDYTPCE